MALSSSIQSSAAIGLSLNKVSAGVCLKHQYSESTLRQYLDVFVSGVHREAERGDSGCGNRGVRLGLHPPHGHHRQPDARRTCGQVWKTEHRRSDHDRQRHQSGGPAALHLPEHH